jgi:Fe-S-cluster containining protein
MDLHFSCVQCGNCCKGLKLPLTVAEAMSWLRGGHQVQVICEASPWTGKEADEDPPAAHFRRRSFATMSGSLPVRVAVILAASFAGSCPNLMADNRCRIYASRPLVCRIYPAEVNPFIELQPGRKSCPPEAWADEHPLFQRSGRILGAVLRGDIQASRERAADDVDVKRCLCATLQVHDTARPGEGLVVYSPAAETLMSALTAALDASPEPYTEAEWRFVSDRPESMLDLSNAGGVTIHARESAAMPFEFIGYKQPS